MRFHAERAERPFDIVRPLVGISVTQEQLRTRWGQYDWNYIDINLRFMSPISENYALPLPPFPVLDTSIRPHFFIRGGAELFDLEGLSEGWISATFDTMNAEIISNLPAIPEPSSYGMAAVVVFGMALLVRRRQMIL